MHVHGMAFLAALLLGFTVSSTAAQSVTGSGVDAVCPDALSVTPASDRDAAPERTVDLRAVATSVAANARIQPGELVWIRGGAGDGAFMEQLAVAVGALGGQPLVHVFSDAMLRQWYRDVPARFDTQRDEWVWLLSRNADVILEVGRHEPGIWNELPADRLDTYDASNSGLGALVRERNVGRMWLANGAIHPSAPFARMFGISTREIECIYWKGLASDPALLAATGNWLREILEAASTIRVRHPNGTDITVRPGPGSIVVSDGTLPLRRRDSAEPGTVTDTWLPGGEVTLGLDPFSATGRLIVERVFLDGEAIGPLTLVFSDGRLQTMESSRDASLFRERLNSVQHPLSEHLTGLKFGLNPDVTDQRVVPFMGAGMFSLSMGMNSHLGGDIDMPFLVFLTLSGATVYVDGQVVVEDGRLRR